MTTKLFLLITPEEQEFLTELIKEHGPRTSRKKPSRTRQMLTKLKAAFKPCYVQVTDEGECLGVLYRDYETADAARDPQLPVQVLPLGYPVGDLCPEEDSFVDPDADDDSA